MTLSIPSVTIPSVTVKLPDLASTANRVRAALPPPQELVYFAGLGLLGILEVIEWPVVLAVGVGTVIAQQAAQAAARARRSGAATARR